MFILEYKIDSVQGSDITVALAAPVDCRIESAHIVCSVAVASGASPKLVCEIYDDADTNVLLSADSESAGFSQNVPFAMSLQNGVSKRYEEGQAIQLKADVTGSLASATDVIFVLKCVPARDI
jgi:hypothetical protein